MKKILTVILSTILGLTAFGALAGCNGGGEELSPTTIKVSAFKGAYGDKFWEGIKSGFEKLYEAEGYKVSYEATQEPENKIQGQIRVNEGPDVIFLPVGQPKALTESLIKSKSLLKLNDILDENVPGEDGKLRDKFLPGFIGNMSTNPYNNDDTYMLPMFYSPLGLFYNKALFNEDGTGGKMKMPKTWDDFIGLGERARADGRSLFVYPNSGYMTDLLNAMIASNCGTEVFGNFLNYEDVYSSAEFKRVFTEVGKLKGNTLTTSWDSATEFKKNQHALLKNDALFMPCGTWLPTEMEGYNTAEGFEYGFTAPFVLDEQDTPYAVSKLEQVFVLNQSKKKDIAKKFVAYLFSDEATKIIARDAKAVVPTVNALKLAEDNAYIEEQVLSFYKVYDGGKVNAVSGIFAPSNVPGVSWMEKFGSNCNDYMKDTKTISEWLSEMKIAAAQLKSAVVRV